MGLKVSVWAVHTEQLAECVIPRGGAAPGKGRNIFRGDPRALISDIGVCV